MHHLVGLRDQPWRQQQRPEPVVLDTRALINGHMLFAGVSGTGKSYQLIELLTAAARQGVEIDVMDVHEELDCVPGARAVKFSEATNIGYNPLELSTDPHTGGVRRQIAFVVDTINRTSRKLGPRQESVLRNLLADVYHLRGCYADQPDSWHKESITEAEYDAHIRARDYQGLRRYYPTLRDVISYAERKLRALTIGGDGKAANALEQVESICRRMQQIQSRAMKAYEKADLEKLQGDLEKQKAKAIEAYSSYVQSIETGRELAEINKYENRETVLSVLERLQALYDSGIFRANPPEWQGAKVRVYQIGALKDDERKLLFQLRADAILRECMNAGKADNLRRILLVDEGHLYADEDGDSPMNRISKEGRKFGLGLVIASQAPTHFSEDFLTNCGSIFLLGIDEAYWDASVRKMKIDLAMLRQVIPREVIAARLKRSGEAGARFEAVNVNRAAVQKGVEVFRAQYQQAQARRVA